MALSKKHRAFVEEYLSCFNATEAYHRVYSPRTRAASASNGYQLLRNTEIEQAIKERLAETAMSADEVLMRLAEQARGDLGKFLNKDGDAITIDLEAMKADGKTHLIKRISQTKRRRTTKDVTEEEVSTTLELYDAQAAQQLIGKHHKLFTDKVSFGDEDGAIPIMLVQPGQLDKLKP